MAKADTVEEAKKEPIQLVAHRFGREDMDEVVDKLNAVIEVVNNL